MAQIEVLSEYDCQLVVIRAGVPNGTAVSETGLVPGAPWTKYFAPGTYDFSCSRPDASGGKATTSLSISAGGKQSISFAMSDFAVSGDSPLAPIPDTEWILDFPFQPIIANASVDSLKVGNEIKSALFFDVEDKIGLYDRWNVFSSRHAGADIQSATNPDGLANHD